ncbi:hypothetical protein LCGC14_1839300, partial [marine sediment metagenome]
MAVDLESEKIEIEPTGKIAQVLELVEGMSLLEASQLVKAFEEKFGVSASAAIAASAVGAAPAATEGAGAAEEEKTSFDIILTYDQSAAAIDIKPWTNSSNHTLGYLTYWVYMENISLIQSNAGGYKRISQFEFGETNNDEQVVWSSDVHWENQNFTTGWNYVTLNFSKGLYVNRARINWSDVDYIQWYAINASPRAINQTEILIDDLRFHPYEREAVQG